MEGDFFIGAALGGTLTKMAVRFSKLVQVTRLKESHSYAMLSGENVMKYYKLFSSIESGAAADFSLLTFYSFQLQKENNCNSSNLL